MKRKSVAFFGVLVILVGLGFIFPAVAHMRDAGVLPTAGVGLLLLGVALTLSGGGAIFYAARPMTVKRD